MSLRKKTLIMFSVAMILFIVILNVVAHFTITNGFSHVEEDITHTDVERVINILSDQIDSMDSTNTDWASWDDSYEFIANVNTDYIESNLVEGTYVELEINAILFVDTSGNIVCKRGYDLEEEEEVDVPQSLLDHISTTDILLPGEESSVAGIISLTEGPMLITSRPILTSELEGPSRGNLIMGRYLNDTEIEHLEELTQVSLGFYSVDDPQLSSDLQSELDSLSEESPISVEPLNDDVIAGYGLLNDIYGEPVLLLQVDVSRDIYSQGQTSMTYLLISLVGIGIIFSAVILYLLERLVLSRLARLRRNVDYVTFGQGPATRVLATGNDELSALAKNVNEMLDRLEQSYSREYELRQERENEIERRARFTSALVHELKTPLTPITASSDLLIEELEEGPLLSLAKNINRGAHTLDERIGELLDIAKGDLNMLELNRTEIDPLQLLQTVSEEVAPVALNNGQVFSAELPSSLKSVWVDETRLHQVILNLFNNASKFTPRGGTITLKARDEDNTLIVEVQDSGPGIPAENQEAIFDPYYRLETDRQYTAGLGLGLALCKIIVGLHKGQIWVNSEAGKGSTFGFYVPHYHTQD